MRTIQATLLSGVVVITAAACGLPYPTYASARATNEAVRLRSLVNDLEELPDVFSARPRPAWRPPFRARNAACRQIFDVVAGRPPETGLIGVTAVTYEGRHLGELAGVGLAAYRDEGVADDRLDELRVALDRCETADGGTPGAADRLTSAPLPVLGGGADPIGDPADQVVTRLLAGRVGGYPYRMYVVVATSGRTLVALLHAGVAAPDLASTAKLAALLGREVGTLDS